MLLLPPEACLQEDNAPKRTPYVCCQESLLYLSPEGESMQRFFLFLKRNVDLDAAVFLAAASCFIDGIDPIATVCSLNYEILLLLACLMTVVAGFRKEGLLNLIFEKSLHFVHNMRSFCRLFIFLCFFLSMLITNDVALIIFVPIAIGSLLKLKRRDLVVKVVSLQTIAANMGSMLTPIGNPQNLYIFVHFNYRLTDFMSVTFPIFSICFILLLILTSLIKADPVIPYDDAVNRLSKRKVSLLSVSFIICILCVLRVLDVYLSGLIVLALILFTDKKLLLGIDAKLLSLFFFLFVFVGNVASSSAVAAVAHEFVQGYEYFVSLTLSQIISNVPAAVLLSDFVKNPDMLLIGVSVGGLGTIIASMASLISFKYYMRMDGQRPIYYLRKFTKYNIEFLLILVPIHCIFSSLF